MAITRVSTSSVREGLDKFNNAIAGFSPAYGRLDSIATVTVGAGGTASIEFLSIPSSFQHLHLRIMTPATTVDGSLNLQYNGVTSGYTNHLLNGNGTSASASGSVSQSEFSFAYDNNTAINSSNAKVAIVDILDYSSTSKNKVTRSIGGIDGNTSNGFIEIRSSLLATTSAITSLKLRQYGNDGTGYGYKNLAQYTTVALYGIRT